MSDYQQTVLNAGEFADVCIFNKNGGNTVKQRFLIVNHHYKNLKDCFYIAGEQESFLYQKGTSNVAYLIKNSKLFKAIEQLKIGETKRYKESDTYISLDRVICYDSLGI